MPCQNIKIMHFYKKIFIATLSVAIMTSCGLMKKDRSGEEMKKEATLPTDREKIVQPVSSVYTSEDLAKGIVKGEWTIENVMGKKAVGEKIPYVNFVQAENKMYGNNGCNVINAEYKYNPSDSTIQFSYMTSSMMLCHKEGITDIEINRALDESRYYSMNLDGDDYYLTLFDADRQEVMTLMHQNFQFLNGTWKILEIDGVTVNVAGMKLVIDVDEGKLHGNTGCNIINGTLEINMEIPNSISFQGIGMTKKSCPNMEYEMQMVMALEQAMRAKPLIGGKVELLDSQDKVILLLERTSDK